MWAGVCLSYSVSSSSTLTIQDIYSRGKLRQIQYIFIHLVWYLQSLNCRWFSMTSASGSWSHLRTSQVTAVLRLLNNIWMNPRRASPRFMTVHHSVSYVSLYLRPCFVLFCCFFSFQIHCLFYTLSSALFLFWSLLYLWLVTDLA